MGLEVYVKGYGVSFPSDENVLKFIAVTVARFCKYIKYCIFKMRNLYVNKPVIKREGVGERAGSLGFAEANY